MFLLFACLILACQNEKTFVANEDVYFDNDTESYRDLYNNKPVTGLVIVETTDHILISTQVKKGKLHGLYTLYLDDDKVQEMSFKNGKANGTAKFWDDNMLEAEMLFKDGEAVTLTCYSDTGEVTGVIDNPTEETGFCE